MICGNVVSSRNKRYLWASLLIKRNVLISNRPTQDVLYEIRMKRSKRKIPGMLKLRTGGVVLPAGIETT